MSLGMQVYDADTGKQVAKYKMPGNSRCDMSRASESYLLMSFGNFVDLSAPELRLVRSEITRSTCGGATGTAVPGGFAAPIGEWLRGPLAGMASDLLLDGRLKSRGLFRDAEVRRLWTDHAERRAEHPHRLWQLLMLELWFRTFIDGTPSADRKTPALPLAEAV